MLDPLALREAALAAARAVERVVEDYAAGLIEQEPDFTSQMVARISETMDQFRSRGLRWTAKVLTDRGRNAQERRFGADLLVVLEIRTRDEEITKGFLAQAKRLNRGESFVGRRRTELMRQSSDMLNLTPASFVLLYSQQGVDVAPAQTLRHAPHEPYRSAQGNIHRFLEEFFLCLNGDRQIHAATVAELSRLRAQYRARNAILLGASGE